MAAPSTARRLKLSWPARRGRESHLEQLPAYAPELNPDEGVWNLKRVELKNIICQHLGQLSYELGKAIKRLRQKPTSFVPASLRLGWFNSLLKTQ